MDGRSDKARFYEDRCRAKMYHERQRANSPNPGPKRERKPKAESRPAKRERPTPRKKQQKPPVRPHSAADSRSEDGSNPYVVGEPQEIDSETWAKIEEGSGRKGTRVTDIDVTTYHNNIISYALTEASSTCKLCLGIGGRPKEKGGVGPLKTKMGKPGALCEGCWLQVHPEEAF